MFSKVLIKLIDRAIVPAILLLATRVVSIFLISKYFGFSASISKAGFVFSDQSDFIKANSYSTLAMVLVLMFGLTYVVTKALAFHETHIKPPLSARLFSLKMHSLIQGSFHLYSEAIVWLSYSYLLLAVSIIMLLSKILYGWVFWLTLGATIIVTALFAIDLDEEIKIKRENRVEYDTDKSFLSEAME